jgi:SAM-dependent methyltransferase
MHELLDLYSADRIATMSYNELIGLTRETNRPPGSAESIARIAQRSFLRPGMRVLEIGTATGFTAIELARLVGCTVEAIDINPLSLGEAARRATDAGVEERVNFRVADAVDTGFDAESFDMVFCGNVTTLIDDRERALAEYVRVLRPNGLLAATPMYYLEPPPPEVVTEVSRAIGVELIPAFRDDALGFFARAPLRRLWTEDYAFENVPDDRVRSFVRDVLAQPHLDALGPDARACLAKRYGRLMMLFRDNLTLMGYTLALFRREDAEGDPELFTSRRIERS